MTDPMESYEQAEAEADERQDEARREQHWREAEAAVVNQLQVWFEPQDRDVETVQELLTLFFGDPPRDDDERIVQAFTADYGTPALLRVIANALEQK